MSDDSIAYDRLVGNPTPPARRGRGRGKDKGPDEQPAARLVELNVRFTGGLDVARATFLSVWAEFIRAQTRPDTLAGTSGGLVPVATKYYQCVLSARECRDLLAVDRGRSRGDRSAESIFKIWPDYTLHPQIDRSVYTVKADAARRSFAASGKGIVWAVIDSGIDATHPHFGTLELGRQAADPTLPAGVTGGRHRDFRALVTVTGQPAPPEQPLVDEMGHGTHVAGILSGSVPDGAQPHVAAPGEPSDGGFVTRRSSGVLRGMAPDCELISLRVLRFDGTSWITSSAAVIAALEYVRTTVNSDPSLLTVHGVNLSIACPWVPQDYAAGRSPLSQTVNSLSESGVVVVVAVGNYGGALSTGPGATAAMGSIAEPAHAEGAIAVGSTHRDAPHAFGVTWSSSKGPTLDGRRKPDVIAPGERITSAATGSVRSRAGLDGIQGDHPQLTYAELSGTSQAAPHVSGVVAAFLSAYPEFIGRPREVARFLADSATDLGREHCAQGAGLIDLMRMLSAV